MEEHTHKQKEPRGQEKADWVFNCVLEITRGQKQERRSCQQTFESFVLVGFSDFRVALSE